MECKIKPQRMKKGVTYVHVNTHFIKAGNKIRKAAIDGEISEKEALRQMPYALKAQTGQNSDYGSTVIITHPETGEEVGRFEHTPFNPYGCGAQIVFQTKMNVNVIQNDK